MKKLKLISLILAVVMLASMLPFGAMISAFAAEGDQPVADEDWYDRETTDDDPDVLEINNVSEFFAFAEKLDEGTADAPAFTRTDAETGALIPLTVKLNTHIILNDGWDAINVAKAENVKEPAVTYPVSASSFFGGTFDGNGYILSGLYLNETNQYVGLFGNVVNGTTATVKNVIIKNSFIQSNAQGVGAIFGVVFDQPYNVEESDPTYGKETKGVIENVFVEATVSCSGTGKKSYGTGGFVGGTRAYVDVKDSAFVGTVFGGVRGAGGVVGATCGPLGTNSSGAATKYFNESHVRVNVENVYIQAHVVIGDVQSDHAGMGGGIVGYMPAGNEDLVAKNVVVNCTFDTKEVVDDGQGGTKPVLETKESRHDSIEDPNDLDDKGNPKKVLVEKREVLYKTGYLVGYTNAGFGKTTTTKDGTEFVYMDWTFDNVYYVKDQNNKLLYESAYYQAATDGIITINGKLMDTSYDKDTGVVASGLYSLTNWTQYKADSENVTLYTDVEEIGYNGEARTYNDDPLYAKASEVRDQVIRNYFDEYCALPANADENWGTTLTEKMTGLDATKWEVRGNYILPKALNDMLAAVAEAMDVQSDVPTADPDWYDNETANDSKDLVIYNADDLLAFAEALKAKKNFAGMTVTLSTNVVLNKDFDAFAENVTAPDVVWPLANGEGFAGTFDGNGKTISGIYYEVPVNQGYAGIFGNVATGTAATVKNLAIVNSYVTASGSNGQGIGGIFGIVDKETGTAVTDPNYVNITKATIDNVYAEINIQNKGADKHGSNGTGGFIGGVRTDAEITNSAFVGNVNGGGVRGAGGLIGTITTESSRYLNTVTIKDCYVNAAVTENTTASNREVWVGGLVGRVDHAVTTLNVTDVVSDCEVTGNAAGGATATFGYLVGGANVTKDTSVSVAEVASNCTFNFENVTYVATTGNATEPVGKGGGKINGTASDFTGVGDAWATYGVTKTDDASSALAELDGWSNANGTPLPTSLFNAFYTGFVGQNLTIGKDLSLNIYVKVDGALSQYDGVFAIGFEPGTEPSNEDAIDVVSKNMGNGIHKFTLTVPAADMGDEIAFAYFITEDEYEECRTSVKDYLVSLMDTDAELASAMLRYGAAAQVVAGDTGALVTEGVDLAPAVDTTENLTNNATFEGTENADYFVKGVKMFFQDGVMKLEVKCYFDSIASTEGVQITVDGRTNVVFLNYQNMTPVETETRTYTAVFTNIDLVSMNDDITLVIKKSASGDVYSQTMTTDMDDMIADFLASDASDAEKALVKAMHAVGVALAD